MAREVLLMRDGLGGVLELPAIPYADWEPTKSTLHLWCQIVGKIALRSSSLRNHWWNVTLHPTARGVTTRRLVSGSASFEISFDFIRHRLVVEASTADEPVIVRLRDGLSVAEFYEAVMAALERLGISVSIVGTPYGVAAFTVPFAEDREHRSYDGGAVRRWWDVIRWTSDVMEAFASEFVGKQSPVHLFWHSFDLAMARYSGRPAGVTPPSDPVQREAYSHEVIAFGFWAGDVNVPAPTYYTYTAPEPATLTTFPLLPDGASWSPAGNGHMGTVPYDVIRAAADPRAALLAFLHSAYDAGTSAAGWNRALLAHA